MFMKLHAQNQRSGGGGKMGKTSGSSKSGTFGKTAKRGFEKVKAGVSKMANRFMTGGGRKGNS